MATWRGSGQAKRSWKICFINLQFPISAALGAGGTLAGGALPADTAAIEYARRIMNDLREERRREEPRPSIAVKNAAGEVIYRFPSN